MNAKEFSQMFYKDLYPDERQKYIRDILAQEIDKRFISIEKHLHLSEKAKLEKQRLEIRQSNQ